MEDSEMGERVGKRVSSVPERAAGLLPLESVARVLPVFCDFLKTNLSALLAFCEGRIESVCLGLQHKGLFL